MSSFSVTPRTGSNPATSGSPKRNIQFQWDGRDIGRRNTDTFNLESLVNGLQVSIGVGEQVNVLQVGGGAVPVEPGGWDPDSIFGNVELSEENYVAALVPPGAG